MDVPVNKIVCGEAKAVMNGWPAESINCSISSPPYWALRDYGTATWEGGKADCDHIVGRHLHKGWKGTKQESNPGSSAAGYAKPYCPKCGAKRIDKQLGLEPTFEEYIDKLCGIYDEVKRVLRDDGTCWVNLGDTYWGGKGQSGQGSPEYQEARQDVSINKPASHVGGQKLTRPQDVQHDTIQAKSLCLIPQRFAIEMVNRGWILRNVIIWHKPNPMPSSAKDRFTVDFEYVYFFVKSKRYWFEPQYEPHNTPIHLQEKRVQAAVDAKTKRVMSGDGDALEKWSIKKPEGARINPLGRNKRTVWTIPTQPFPEAHFATFPEKLVEPMILSGCPEFVCTKCGKGREKVYDREVVHNRPNTRPDANVRPDNYERIPSDWKPKETKCLGYSDCGCGVEYRPGIVLDPFVVRARPVWSLPKTEGIGLGLSLNRNISKWRNAA